MRSLIYYPFQCPHYLMPISFNAPPLLGSFDETNSLVTFLERVPFGKLYETLLIFSQTRQRSLFTVWEHEESRHSDWSMKHQPWVKRPVWPARSLPSLLWMHLYSMGPFMSPSVWPPCVVPSVQALVPVTCWLFSSVTPGVSGFYDPSFPRVFPCSFSPRMFVCKVFSERSLS